MTTATAVPISITCPDWCVVTPEKHAEDLWNAGGECHHTSDVVKVTDPVGYSRPLDEPRFSHDIDLVLGTSARPEDGREVASPLIYLDGREYTIEQMEALVAAVELLVESYRAGGQS
jgi:hypothetical protein